MSRVTAGENISFEIDTPKGNLSNEKLVESTMAAEDFRNYLADAS